MAPEPCQEAEKAERQAALCLADQEPVSDHREPPAGTPKDPVAPACLKDTKPSPTPVVFPVNLQLAPESLDPRTLRLLWGQRELEIQALRWTIRNRQNARHCHILYEVAGLPPESCSHSQEKLLQSQVQKLTLELKGQKEQAQLEKSQLETELQAFQRSCLLQLARSSWVGRVLRSSTGSVEVVTAETLMDSSDLSENDQVPSTGEGFRLEDVDWNSIAHRYPNLLANIKSNSDQNPINSSLKIVAVSRKERFVRVLNRSLEDTADLGGLTLRQLLYGFPACMYRFPPGTLLAPGHHVTQVWGEGPSSTKKQPPSSLGQEPVHFHSGRGCVTLLLNPKGEVRVLSEHRAPHCVTPVSRIFADNTDLSVDRFPLSEDGLGADPGEQSRGPQHSRGGRVREAGARRQRPGTRGLLPRLSTSKRFRPREVPARPGAAETRKPELLPALPEAGLCLEHCGASKEHRVRVCRRSVDRGCPMVALSVQSTAESRYGFRFLPCPPVTADPGARV